MSGQMCWLPKLGTDGEKILHLRLQSHDRWMPYTALPAFSVPDYKIRGGSKGWATYQKLMQAGWVLVPTAQAYTLSAPQPSLLAS
ncbi:hypothetical protein H6G89_04550 [Oscillatoria sp. FACHB-1407]|uniref:hypothetical protein n=1 Tax=Oscillatoria sp. FACHB-1407 TaxID=2692847 RepID=UPI0016830790|nr:hypothetical protein [Oscillatoria sp. FACHB-1407]MBD2460307.1 hypothetical protein [Oscillatoria sp. FACHB-1407]